MNVRQQLADAIQSATPHIGRHEIYRGVFAIRNTHPGNVVPTVYTPSLCIIAQGEKHIVLEHERYMYDESRMLLFAVDLPVMAQITRADMRTPYLGLRIDLDAFKIAELIPKVYPDGFTHTTEYRGVSVIDRHDAILQSVTRLIELHTTPQAMPLIAPLIIEEILIRLLQSTIGQRVAQIGLHDSHVQRISRAIDWIRHHYRESISIDDLADMVHMSNSAFHQHFKTITAMTPLQFQKHLRLQHARHLMLTTNLNATQAAFEVGYTSVSQFSREYRRLFGDAPVRNLERLRTPSIDD